MDKATYMHTMAFRGNVVNGTQNTAIALVSDDVIARNNAGNALAPSQMHRVRWGVAGGVNASRARINTPSMRFVGLPFLAPLNTGVAVPSPPNLADFGDFGPQPNDADEITVESTHTDAAPQIQFAVVTLRFGRKAIPPGDRYRIRATSAIAGVVGSWVSGSLTFDQNLPSGIYTIVGMDVFGTNLIAGRLIFPGGGWRPGCLARNAVGSVPHRLFTNDDLGCYGDFDSTAPPTVQGYCEAANAAQEWYFDIVRTGNRP